MRFRILGPLEAFVDGRWRHLGAPKWRLLLAIMLTSPNHLVSTDQLIVELWGDRPPKTARNQVHGYVMRLRRTLREPGLVTRESGYEIAVAADDVDAGRFDTLVGQGVAALAGGDPRQAADTLAVALALWRGPAFADVPPNALVQAAAARLHDRRLAAVDAHLDAELRLGRNEDVAARAEHLIADHPLREQLWEHLMLALYRSGRPAEALTTYDRLCKALIVSAGTVPGVAVERLRDQIKRADPGLTLT